uniref:Uncharacterized protein n=1 Tax=viral metagenome TaxID=1070528 RepID=A0A6M3LQX0_9ZZZZ
MTTLDHIREEIAALEKEQRTRRLRYRDSRGVLPFDDLIRLEELHGAEETLTRYAAEGIQFDG